MMTIKLLKGIKKGRFIRVRWDDCGVLDGILVYKEEAIHPKSTFGKVFFLCDHEIRSVNCDQVVSVGPFIKPVIF